MDSREPTKRENELDGEEEEGEEEHNNEDSISLPSEEVEMIEDHELITLNEEFPVMTLEQEESVEEVPTVERGPLLVRWILTKGGTENLSD